MGFKAMSLIYDANFNEIISSWFATFSVRFQNNNSFQIESKVYFKAIANIPSFFARNIIQ